MQMKLKVITSVLIVGLIMISCGQAPEKKPEAAPLAVTVKQADMIEVLHQYQFTGRVVSNEKITLRAKMAGTIEQIAEAGQSVRKGELIVKISNRELMAQLGSAKALQSEAKSNLAITYKNYQRMQRLFEKGSATQSELDDIKTAYDMSMARVESATQSINEINESLRYTRLVSPIDGFVSQKISNEGNIASAGSPLLTLESSDQLKIKINVPEFEIGVITQQAAVRIEVPALSEDPFHGWVDKIVPSSEFSGVQYRVSIRFKVVHGLKPGMFAEVTLLQGKEQKIMVPPEAIYHRGQLTGVYGINQNDEALLRWVRLGKTYPQGIEVLSGLDQGESVIISVEGKLFDGAKIQVVN